MTMTACAIILCIKFISLDYFQRVQKCIDTVLVDVSWFDVNSRDPPRTLNLPLDYIENPRGFISRQREKKSFARTLFEKKTRNLHINMKRKIEYKLNNVI